MTKSTDCFSRKANQSSRQIVETVDYDYIRRCCMNHIVGRYVFLNVLMVRSFQRLSSA